MTRIAIDFAPRGWRRTLGPLSLVWYAVLALTVVIAIAASVLAYRVYARDQARQALVDRIAQREAAHTRANPPVAPDSSCRYRRRTRSTPSPAR